MSAGITTVIVSKGLDALLGVCLTHLRVALEALDADGPGSPDPPTPHAIVVVDNASPIPYDLSRFPFSGIELLRFDVDQSFGRACNAGFAAHPNDRVLLLNNDVLLSPDALRGMLRLLESRPDVGLCGSRLVFPDGRIQHCGVVFGAGKIGPYHVDRGRRSDRVLRGPRELQAVTGACLLVRRSVWDALGGLDESYPFGLEDIDLCLRARQRGWRVLCDNDSESLHFESMTPGRVELDVGSRRLFMQRWSRRYTLDG
ncbi:MAG: glycosyltransferase [bacterium]